MLEYVELGLLLFGEVQVPLVTRDGLKMEHVLGMKQGQKGLQMWKQAAGVTDWSVGNAKFA